MKMRQRSHRDRCRIASFCRSNRAEEKLPTREHIFKELCVEPRHREPRGRRIHEDKIRSGDAEPDPLDLSGHFPALFHVLQKQNGGKHDKRERGKEMILERAARHERPRQIVCRDCNEQDIPGLLPMCRLFLCPTEQCFYGQQNGSDSGDPPYGRAAG